MADPELPIPKVDSRIYVPAHDGINVLIKRDSHKEYCFHKFPHEDHFHLMLEGEIFLEIGHERYCLECANILGLISDDRLYWQKPGFRTRGKLPADSEHSTDVDGSIPARNKNLNQLNTSDDVQPIPLMQVPHILEKDPLGTSNKNTDTKDAPSENHNLQNADSLSSKSHSKEADQGTELADSHYSLKQTDDTDRQNLKENG